MAVERLEAFDKYISLYDVEYVEKGLTSLKFNKAGGIDGLTKVCITYCHPDVLVHLKLFCNMVCLHGFVPDSFDTTVVHNGMHTNVSSSYIYIANLKSEC